MLINVFELSFLLEYLNMFVRNIVLRSLFLLQEYCKIIAEASSLRLHGRDNRILSLHSFFRLICSKAISAVKQAVKYENPFPIGLHFHRFYLGRPSLRARVQVMVHLKVWAAHLSPTQETPCSNISRTGKKSLTAVGVGA